MIRCIFKTDFLFLFFFSFSIFMFIYLFIYLFSCLCLNYIMIILIYFFRFLVVCVWWGLWGCYLFRPIFIYLFIYLFSPNTIMHHQISQKLSPKHAARGAAQSPYPIYRHGKACLSKQPPWRAAGDPRLARGRSRVWAPGPVGALRVLFFSTLPSFILREIGFFAPSPPNPQKC